MTTEMKINLIQKHKELKEKITMINGMLHNKKRYDGLNGEINRNIFAGMMGNWRVA